VPYRLGSPFRPYGVLPTRCALGQPPSFALAYCTRLFDAARRREADKLSALVASCSTRRGHKRPRVQMRSSDGRSSTLCEPFSHRHSTMQKLSDLCQPLLDYVFPMLKIGA
jgi:hypothetical protein